MTSKNGNNCWRSNLLPHADEDDDDELIRKMEEETNMAIMQLSSEHDDNMSLKTGTIPPVELSVDVEVEECDETDNIIEDWSIDNASNVDNTPSAMNIDENNTAEQLKTVSNPIRLDMNKLFRELDSIITNSPNSVDVELALEVRNIWGRHYHVPHVMSELDEKIQVVLNSWNSKENLITYKCYICFKAWWFLHPFKEHVKSHSNVEIGLEKCNLLANVIAYKKGWSEALQVINVQGNCYKCNGTFNSHIIPTHKYKYVRCGMANSGMTSGAMEKEKCTVCRYVGNLEEHYVTCHSVRSDLPIDTRAKVCKSCKETYYVLSMHECRDKVPKLYCKYCLRVYGTARRLELHNKLACHGQFQCKYCDLVIYGKCMKPDHLSIHSTNFKNVLVCASCKGNLIYTDIILFKEHLTKKHELFFHKRKAFELIVPKSCLISAQEEGQELISACGNDSCDAGSANLDKKAVKAIEPSSQYEFLLSRVLNSSIHQKNATDNDSVDSNIMVKQEGIDEQSVVISLCDSNNSDDIQSFATPSTQGPEVEVTVAEDDATCGQVQEIVEEFGAGYEIKIEETDLEDGKIEIVVQGTQNKTQDVITHEEVANAVKNIMCGDENRFVDSDDEDVLVVEVEDEIYEIEDDSEVEELGSNGSQDIETRVLNNINSGIHHNEVQEQDMQENVAKESETENNDAESAGIQEHKNQDRRVNEDETLVNRDKSSEIQSKEIHVNVDQNMHESERLIIPKVEIGEPQIKIEHITGMEDMKDAVANIEITIMDNGKENSDFDIPKFEVSIEQNYSDSTMLYMDCYNKTQDEDFQWDYTDDEMDNQAHSKKGYYTNKVPKVYTCTCGYSSFHKQYANHKKICTVTRKRGCPRKIEQRVYVTESCDQKKNNNKKDFLDLFHKYKCTKCMVNSSTLKKYLGHFNTHHGYRAFSCPVCMQLSRCWSSFSNHVKSHIKQSYYKSLALVTGVSSSSIMTTHCKVCKHQVLRKDTFKHWEAHLKINEDEQRIKKESFKEILENTTMDRSLLKSVIEIMEPTYDLSGVSWSRGCVVCRHVFNRRSDYKRHLVEHLLTDAFNNKVLYGALRCQICSYDTIKDRFFRNHVREHACLTIYKCKPCNRVFSNSSNFSKHKKLHAPNAVICDYCKKTFLTKSAIEKHVLEEHLSTTFKRVCPHCRQEFKKRMEYKVHLRLHNAHRLYGCQYCREGFSCVKDLWEHKWTAHGERNSLADCFVCGKEFRKFNDLKRHMRKDHNIAVSKETLEARRAKYEMNRI